MRSRRLTAVLLLGAALVALSGGAAGAYSPTVVPIGFPPLEVNGGFKPTRLPKGKLGSIGLELEGNVGAADDGHLPTLEQLVVNTDRNVVVDAKGLPSCKTGKIVGPDIVPPSKGGCKTARIGEGEVEFEVKFPESEPFLTTGHAIAINGGVEDGVTTIFVYAYLSNPVLAATITVVKITKLRGGPNGARWTATIPVVAGGSGSLKKFQLELFRQFTYRGKRKSYLSARCATGKLSAHWEAKFADSATGASGAFARPCTPKG